MSRAATRRVLTLALAMFCLVGAGAQLPPPGYDRPRDGPYPDTLEFLLRALDLDYTRLPGGMPTLRIWNYDYENNADLFAIAFYYRDPNDSNRMLDTLEVIVLDKATGTWKRRAFDAEHMAGLFKTADPGPGPGSVMNVWHTRRYLLIDTHLTPSAGTIIVLTRALEPTAMLYGWTLFTLANESIVYHASNMHFAPTHDLNVRMYDPRSGKTRTIYPTKPYDPPRREFIELTRKAYARYGDDWFRQHNHHKDAEQFNSRWGQLWIVDERTNAMAFAVMFGSAPDRGLPDSPDTVVPQQEIAVACRNIQAIDRVTCRESSLPALRASHPGLEDSDLLRIAARELASGTGRRFSLARGETSVRPLPLVPSLQPLVASPGPD